MEGWILMRGPSTAASMVAASGTGCHLRHAQTTHTELHCVANIPIPSLPLLPHPQWGKGDTGAKCVRHLRSHCYAVDLQFRSTHRTTWWYACVSVWSGFYTLVCSWIWITISPGPPSPLRAYSYIYFPSIVWLLYYERRSILLKQWASQVIFSSVSF